MKIRKTKIEKIVKNRNRQHTFKRCLTAQISKVYVGPSEGSKNARNGRKKILNIHGKILNCSKISFFDVRSAVFAHNRHKTRFKVESQSYDPPKIHKKEP